MTSYAPMSDPRDGGRTLLLALAALLTIVICVLTVLYASGAVELNSTWPGEVITTGADLGSSSAG